MALGAFKNECVCHGRRSHTVVKLLMDLFGLSIFRQGPQCSPLSPTLARVENSLFSVFAVGTNAALVPVSLSQVDYLAVSPFLHSGVSSRNRGPDRRQVGLLTYPSHVQQRQLSKQHQKFDPKPSTLLGYCPRKVSVSSDCKKV